MNLGRHVRRSTRRTERALASLIVMAGVIVTLSVVSMGLMLWALALAMVYEQKVAAWLFSQS